MRKFTCLLMFLFLISAGCAPLISRELRRELSPDITFKKVIKDPDVHKGKTIFISGIILDSRNTKEGTMIEILQKPADMHGRPKDVDDSDGRFLALYDGYLDIAIYIRGRDVAVAGEITGKRIQPLGEIDYIYPLISIQEIHLFKVRKEEKSRYCPYPSWWWYVPWWYHP
ncbi:MAG: Slp family lipoprotein [Deltaproteobacteria bacterium]|nr:Slp family lipoprotein [Deltaproteobacteria bacterium]